MSHDFQTAQERDSVILELISYNHDEYEKFSGQDPAELVNHLKPDRVNWINVDGENLSRVLDKIQEHFNLHTLVVEDILNEVRPKAEEFESHLFVTLKMLYKIEGASIDYEQISFVLGDDFLLTFQEKEGDMFDPFRERIRLDQGRVRKKGPDYLLYRLVDITVDNYYTILDAIGERIEETETAIRTNSEQDGFADIQHLKKELIYLHKALYPLRDALGKLIKDEVPFIEEVNIKYFRDVYDHVIHLIDSLETYRDLTSSLMDIYVNTQNSRLNEVIRVLTIISTIFIPLTFIVGVYGMNFHHFPELEWRYGYLAVWMVMIALAVSMMGYFRYKKWM